jgi:hypothetical protein
VSQGVIRLTTIERDRHAAYYAFHVEGPIERLFWDCRELTIHASEGVTSDIARLAAGFLCAMAPVAWTHGARVVLPFAIPEESRRMLSRVGRHLAAHYGWPHHDVTAGIRAVDEPLPPAVHAGLMFSGGVDSLAALLELEDRIDWLIHLTNFENLDSRMTEAQIEDGLATTRATAHERGLGWMHLRTNLASIFKHNLFDDCFPKDCSFWLGLEHVHQIATALSVLRPRLARTYVAGGFSELLAAVGSCAASASFLACYDATPPLDLVHERVMRQEKVERILDGAPELLRRLRVCYSSGDGTCAECRKCQATAMMILSGGGSIDATSFPPVVLDRVLETIARLSAIGPEGHGFYNQSLAGRRLHGTREERWVQLAQFARAQKEGAPI